MGRSQPTPLRIASSGISAPVRNNTMRRDAEETEGDSAANGALPLSPAHAAERITPKDFKQERQRRAEREAKDILASRPLEKSGDVAPGFGAAAVEAVNGYTPSTALAAPTDVVLDPAADSIRARGMAAMAKSSAPRPGRPSTESCAEVDDPSLRLASKSSIDIKDTDFASFVFAAQTSGEAPVHIDQDAVEVLAEQPASEKAEKVAAEPEPSECRVEDMLPPFSNSCMRQFFTRLDDEGAGKITKNQWVDFFKRNANLRKLLLKDEDDAEAEDDARIMRRLLRQVKEVDTNKDGFVDWDEFLGYFRRCGYVLNSEEDSKG